MFVAERSLSIMVEALRTPIVSCCSCFYPLQTRKQDRWKGEASVLKSKEHALREWVTHLIMYVEIHTKKKKERTKKRIPISINTNRPMTIPSQLAKCHWNAQGGSRRGRKMQAKVQLQVQGQIGRGDLFEGRPHTPVKWVAPGGGSRRSGRNVTLPSFSWTGQGNLDCRGPRRRWSRQGDLGQVANAQTAAGSDGKKAPAG